MQPLAKLIWMDGRLRPWEEARVHVMAHTLHYGMGVFEGIRCYAQNSGSQAGPPAIFRLEEHVDRLFDSARCIGMDVPFDRAALMDACRAAVRENGISDGYLRPIAFHADGEPGLGSITPVSVAVIAFAWGAYLGRDGLEKGVRTTISPWIRGHGGASMHHAKVAGQYTTSVLAKRLAKRNGFDEALLCDVDGNLCEGTGENLFVVRGGVLKTPPEWAAILPGITRRTVLTLARSMAAELKIEVREEPFARDELFLAEEAFLTGTAAEITPIREVDHQTIGSGRRGPVTEALQRVFFRIVRGEEFRDPAWRAWLAPVGPA